jgi:hypothetical protein
MGAVPEGTPTRLHWDGAALCLDVEIMPDRDYNGHTIRISLLADAIRVYAGQTPAQKVASDARLARYIYKQFGAYFADRDHSQDDDRTVTEWKIMADNLAG